ncbi:MAG: transposase, partial [Lachnospiraceae bacterium]|nr:transposase [Lachnospiraceae bacterium]
MQSRSCTIKVGDLSSRISFIIKRKKEATTMAKNQRTYDHEYKVQAVKLAQEMGSAAAARELGISRNTVYGWVKHVKDGTLDIGN